MKKIILKAEKSKGDRGILSVKYLEPGKLKPDARNTKQHPPTQVLKIANAIKEFGFNDPIAIDENNKIIEGHGRLLAAKKLKLKAVPTIQLVGLSVQQKRAYAITHNKLTMDTEFDIKKLAKELGMLVADDLLQITGFSQKEFEAIGILNAKIAGAKELNIKDFDISNHTCPKCGFKFQK